jgi:hypothetical protein
MGGPGTGQAADRTGFFVDIFIYACFIAGWYLVCQESLADAGQVRPPANLSFIEKIRVKDQIQGW